MKRFAKLVLLLLPAGAAANEYPTLERVDEVLTCMRREGGQTVENLYACACEIDVIAGRIAFDDFTEARTFEMYRSMPGEKGGIFRDSERGAELLATLGKARAEARKRCFAGRRTVPAGAAAAERP
jgi:hypothetical protein